MQWEGKKVSIICSNEEGINNDKICLYISRKEIQKTREAIYLCLTMTSRDISNKRNCARGKEARGKVQQLAEAVKLDMTSSHERKRFLLDMYFKSTYLYNDMILDDLQELDDLDTELLRTLFKAILKCRDRVITTNGTRLLQAPFHVTSTRLKLEKEVENFLSKQRMRVEKEVDRGNENSMKLKKLAKRCLWIAGRTQAPVLLRKTHGNTVPNDDWLRKVEIHCQCLYPFPCLLWFQWNQSRQGEGYRRSAIPRVKWGTKPPLWRSNDLSGDLKRMAVKWFIGKLPNPKKGMSISRQIFEVLTKILPKGATWGTEEEVRVKHAIESLRLIKGGSGAQQSNNIRHIPVNS